MLWRVLSFDLTKCDFCCLFHTERSWVLFLVGRIGPLMKTSGSLLRLNMGFRFQSSRYNVLSVEYFFD